MKQLRGTPLKRFLRGLQPPSPTELAIVCQSVAYPVNVGSVFRIADATKRFPGVSAADQTRVFEPFFSTRESTGLGLSICHAIVRQHDGELSVQTREGGGSSFRMTLPALSEAEPAGSAPVDDDPAKE